MEKNTIQPDRITKPFQLLAAWLVGLIVVNASFLGAASLISLPYWGPNALIIASIANVPLFIGSIFLLQTKFRAEMQTDDYYSDHLKRKHELEKIDLSKLKENIQVEVEETLQQIEEVSSIPNEETRKEAIKDLVQEKEFKLLADLFKESIILYALNRNLSIKYNNKKIEAKSSLNESFNFSVSFGKWGSLHDEIIALLSRGIIELEIVKTPNPSYLLDKSDIKATKLGEDLIDYISKNRLWLRRFYNYF